ncbi:Lipoprotein-anchoring transpeptidase ErfK/SrfK [Saccharopolyspora antimicrobica]|uniref:Lipoprotein-anchoring transpeptidase ErfK/SrfK n=2 Tax=Saccharopolyspora antimicrobica TaxID=455193 RepID=A0A1I4WS36_9PSEU|nr:peptidoglycan transpeptidase precursor (ErfK-YbiS-YhnG family) [Saccharopolyspora antimicrobica]SFN15819.1 Lipoprotein-anchoring transpeptidase ErfK/SrfK [Saccharopolyspora antimicrobica]
MREWRNPVGGPVRVSRLLTMLIFGVVALLVAGCSGSGGSGTGSGSDEVPPAPTLELAPLNGAKDVSPAEPITAKVANGRIVNAVLTNTENKQVGGTISPDGASWTAGEKLGYGKTYTLEVTAQGASGPAITQQSTFTTVSPGKQSYVSMNPLDGQTVGVGQPLAFYFSKDAPAPDKAKAEAAIKIQTEPAVEGAFYWFNSREVHWRPKEYWKPGTKVTIDVDVFGRDLGNGAWGQEDRKATITIGDAVILRADGASHQMSIEKNGQVIRTMPVSLGKPSFPSNNGVHVVTEHHATKVMDSTTYGLPLEAGGYRTEVKWAVRISNGGEFLHAAPWSVAQQGNSNVSHGCINMSMDNAKWVYDLLKKGDIVEITNSGGPDLRSWDGFGDWQIPWDQWVAGNR